MKKKLNIAFVILCIILVFTACGRAPGDPAGVTGSTSEELTSSAETTTAASEASTDPTPDESEPTPSASAESTPTGNPVTSNPSAATSSKPAGTTSNPTPPGTTPSSKPADPPTTSKPANPPVTSKPPADPVYTEADYNAIVAEIQKYAQDKEKVKFVWDDANRLTMDNAGYYGTPNLARDKRDGVISTLKFHIDKIENLAYSQSGEGAIATYRIIWYEITETYQSVAFVVLYG